MQRTRLSTLISSASNRFTRWIFNPWRRLSLVIISLLFGYFFAIVASAVAGQKADQDVVVSIIFLIFVESASWLVYGRQPQRPGASPAEPNPQRPLTLEALNAFKVGLTYALFVEAFKLAS